MTYGMFKSTKKAVHKFIDEKLIGAALDLDPPTTLNISRQFTNFLLEAEFTQLDAEEEAEKQISFVRRSLDIALDQWSGIGLPAPVGYTDNNENVLLTWKHERYTNVTGYKPLSPRFVETYAWLTGLGPREFLLPCAAFLKVIGCDPIFVTDGRRDEGIDCIGKMAIGPMRSLLIFVQCKTKETNHWMSSKGVVYQEYGKYASLPKTGKYQEYLKALEIDRSLDGSANVYLILTNGEFDRSAQVAARHLGILLRSVRQLAYFLSIYSSPEQLKKLYSEVSIPSEPDLTINIAPMIRLNSAE